FSRSAALACAPYVAAFTVFRMRPNKSGCQVASNGREYIAEIPVEEVVEPVPTPEPEVVVTALRLEEGLWAVMEGFVETVGKSCERACWTRARATRKLAADAAMF